MKKNIGIYDKLIRIVFAIIVATLFILNVINGTGAIILIILGVYVIVTGFLGRCFLYNIVGLRTCPMKEKPSY